MSVLRATKTGFRWRSYSAAAEERDGIATEPSVDALRAGLSADVRGGRGGQVVGSLHLEPSRHGFGEVGMTVAREWRGRASMAACWRQVARNVA